jgi:hypothetical protein
MELKSFDSFVKELNEEKKDELRMEIAKRIFGGNVDMGELSRPKEGTSRDVLKIIELLAKPKV